MAISVAVTVNPGGNLTSLAGIAPGASAAAINAAISAISTAGGGVVQLAPGTFSLDTAILLKSNVTLRGAGPATTLVPTFSGGTDDATNAVIKILGALDTPTMSSTLSADIRRGGRTCTVAAAGTMTTGKYFVIRGNNATFEGLGSDGTSVVLEEVYRCLSVAGNVITINGMSSQFHAATASAPSVQTVQACLPVTRAQVMDLRISSTNDVAVGVYARYATECTISGISGEGFTRRLIECVGVKGFRIDDTTCLGSNNGIWSLESSCGVTLNGTRCLHGADKRTNAHGLPKFSCWLKYTCSDILVTDTLIRNMSLGFCQWGGYHIQVANMEVTEMYPIPAYNALVSTGEHQSPGPMGVAFMGGAGPLPYAQFARGNSYTNIVGSNSYDDTFADDRFSFFYIHDQYDSSWTNLHAYSVGSPGDATSVMAGMRLSDSGGRIQGLEIRGVHNAMLFENAGFDGDIMNVFIDGLDAVGNNPTFISFNHSMSGDQELRFHNIHFRGNESGQIRFGGTFGGGTHDTNIHFFNFRNGDLNTFTEYARVCRNNTGSAMSFGQVVEIDGTNSTANEIFLKVAAGTTAKPAVIVTGSPLDIGTGYLLAALGPQRRVAVSLDGAGNAGDLWEAAGATKLGHVNNASSLPNGKLNFKIAGAGMCDCTLTR